MKEKNKKSSVWFLIFTLGFLAGFAVLNFRVLSAPAKSLMNGKIGVTEFIEQVQEAYPKSFRGKSKFIELNGLYGRIMGRRVYNNVVLLKNGMLSERLGERDMKQSADVLADFDSYLKEKGIPFCFIQAPHKTDLAGELYPGGVNAFANENADELLSLLGEQEVQYLDLRPLLVRTPEDVEKWFYKTDHHWTPAAALTALKPITEQMETIFDRQLDLTYTDPAYWEEHRLENWFLGSQGKRVGTQFAGTDDLIWYTPFFDTNMSCAVPKHRSLYKGNFVDSNIREQYINDRDYYGKNAYCVYIGGDYPLVQHRNANAPNNLRVLIIKDSFVLPVQAFFSTLFTEVDVIDPRHFTQSTIAEYVDFFQPDCVLMLVNPSISYSKTYAKLDPTTAREREEYRWQEEQVIIPARIEVSPKDNSNNYSVVTSTPKLEPEKRYIFRFDDVRFTQGESAGLAISLYDATKKEHIMSGVFDIAYCRTHNGFEWVFDVPDRPGSELQLIVYAGLSGETSGNGVVYEEVSLHVLNEIGWG